MNFTNGNGYQVDEAFYVRNKESIDAWCKENNYTIQYIENLYCASEEYKDEWRAVYRLIPPKG